MLSMVLVSALLLQMIRALARWHPRCDSALYVDDLIVAASARLGEAAKIAAAGLNFVVFYMTDVLKLQVSTTKSVACGRFKKST